MMAKYYAEKIQAADAQSELAQAAKNFGRGVMMGDDPNAKVPTKASLAGALARDAGLSALGGKVPELSGVCNEAGLAITILQAGAVLPEIARPGVAIGAINRLKQLLADKNKDFSKDDLYQALNKVANGARYGDLTPAQQQSFKDYAKANGIAVQ